MPRLWDADIEITESRARRLIESQFTALSPVSVTYLAKGWDNAAFLVNDLWIFRFPRRRQGAGLIEREARILPMLAPQLPLPIPVPEFLGRPEPGYPYFFAGYRRLAGETACGVALSAEDRSRCAVPLARFLSALHEIPVDASTRSWAPGDELARTDLPHRLPMLRERLTAIAAAAPEIDVDAVFATAKRLADTCSQTSPTCWVHGDLYARHLLLDKSRSVCGIIDWGDVHLGDTALDLSIAFSFLSPRAREIFRSTYGAANNATWDRARFRALHYGAVLASYGLDIGDEPITTVGRTALHYAMEA